jgi:putative endonuclease
MVAPFISNAHLPLAAKRIDSYPPQRMFNEFLEKLQNLFTGNKSEKPQQQKKNPLGERGENLAARELQKKGYRILNRNFKCALGEIDIIARDGKTLVFVEVKTRMFDEPTPEAQVNETKMHQLTKAGKFYLSRYGQPQPAARFDVVAVLWPQGQSPTIRHTENAFEATC